MGALYKVVEGHEPREGLREVMVERELARRRLLRVGSSFPLYKGQPFRVSGLFTRNPHAVSADLYARRGTLGRLIGHEDEVSFALLQVLPGLRPEDAEAKVASVLEDHRVVSFARVRGRVDQAAAPLSLISTTISTLVSALCALVALLTLWGTVYERTPDFALLRSLGFSRGTLLLGVLCEGLVLGIVGALQGILVAEGISLLVLPRVLPMLGGPLPPGAVAGPALLGVGMAVVGALAPGLRASAVPPILLLKQGLQ